MKKIFAIILVFIVITTASDVYAFDKSKGAAADWNSKSSTHPYTGNYMTEVTSSTDNTVSKKTNTD